MDLACITVRLGKGNFGNDHTWVIQDFTISTNISLIENQQMFKIGEEYPLNTSIRPHLPKDLVMVGDFQELFLCWFLVDFKCSTPFHGIMQLPNETLTSTSTKSK